MANKSSAKKQSTVRRERAEYVRRHQKHHKSKSDARKEKVAKEKELNKNNK